MSPTTSARNSASPWATGLPWRFRADYRHVGETWWEPYNVTSRDPIDLVDLRIGLGRREVDGHRLVARISPTRSTMPNSRRAASCSRHCRCRYGLEFSYTF